MHKPRSKRHERISLDTLSKDVTDIVRRRNLGQSKDLPLYHLPQTVHTSVNVLQATERRLSSRRKPKSSQSYPPNMS
jgi:hypothetical protein